ncbi:STAS domain-containing protein [Nitrosomonas europaea]|uniref:STAS domain-containing protein n=1 Tax=Nitrosomonas europaea TaxID=915 RepID=UPI002CFD6206|nr:STAS domain-containing protein [Nitrosomonas europaea]HRN81191.1 STAS domain-containing protein [Nitrosomonas europaea]HRQ07716.1 STAS domain-containing protein [Nitrosomonas europaea]
MAGTDARIRLEGNRLFVGGPVTYDNVVEVIRTGDAAIKADDMLIDLAGVTWVDSSAVSMLLEWMRAAQTYGRRIEFINLPSNLADLIELYDVGSLIPTDKPAESV